jgi:hypothetical protein
MGFGPCGPPGTVPCTAIYNGTVFCNPSTEVCSQHIENDCPGAGFPFCMPLAVDGGGPDGGDGGAPDGGDGG